MSTCWMFVHVRASREVQVRSIFFIFIIATAPRKRTSDPLQCLALFMTPIYTLVINIVSSLYAYLGRHDRAAHCILCLLNILDRNCENINQVVIKCLKYKLDNIVNDEAFIYILYIQDAHLSSGLFRRYIKIIS